MSNFEEILAAKLDKKTKLQAAETASKLLGTNKQLNAFLHKEFKIPTYLQTDKFNKEVEEMSKASKGNGFNSPTALKVTLEVAMNKECESEINRIDEKFSDFIEDEDVKEVFDARLAEYKQFLDKTLQKQLQNAYKYFFEVEKPKVKEKKETAKG